MAKRRRRKLSKQFLSVVMSSAKNSHRDDYSVLSARENKIYLIEKKITSFKIIYLK
jgi:hypothetical protein